MPWPFETIEGGIKGNPIVLIRFRFPTDFEEDPDSSTVCVLLNEEESFLVLTEVAFEEVGG